MKQFPKSVDFVWATPIYVSPPLLRSYDSAINFDSLRDSWIEEVHTKSSFADECRLNLTFRDIISPMRCLAESECLQQGQKSLSGNAKASWEK